MGWTSIYQPFWGSLGTRVLTHPHMSHSSYNPVLKNPLISHLLILLTGPPAILYMSLRRVPSNSAIYDGSNSDPDVSWGSKHQQWWRMVILMVSLWDVSDFSWAFHKATWGLGFVETYGFKRLASLLIEVWNHSDGSPRNGVDPICLRVTITSLNV